MTENEKALGQMLAQTLSILGNVASIQTEIIEVVAQITPDASESTLRNLKEKAEKQRDICTEIFAVVEMVKQRFS